MREWKLNSKAMATIKTQRSQTLPKQLEWVGKPNSNWKWTNCPLTIIVIHILPTISWAEHKLKSCWNKCKWKQLYLHKTPYMKKIPEMKHKLTLFKLLETMSAQYEVEKSSFPPQILCPPTQFSTKLHPLLTFLQCNTWTRHPKWQLKGHPHTINR
jgi:hypothetical protein